MQSFHLVGVGFGVAGVEAMQPFGKAVAPQSLTFSPVDEGVTNPVEIRHVWVELHHVATGLVVAEVAGNQGTCKSFFLFRPGNFHGPPMRRMSCSFNSS